MIRHHLIMSLLLCNSIEIYLAKLTCDIRNRNLIIVDDMQNLFIYVFISPPPLWDPGLHSLKITCPLASDPREIA